MRKVASQHFLGLAVALFSIVFAFSAEAQVKAQVVTLQPAAQQSPQIEARIKGKTSKPKNWLEVEAELTFSSSPAPKDGFVDGVEVTFYVLLKSKKFLTGKQTYRNVPIGEKLSAVAYLSPLEFQRMSENKNPGTGDIVGVAVEIKHNGQLVGGDQKGFPNAASKPWQKATADGALLSKKESPFRDLYYDRYLEAAE